MWQHPTFVAPTMIVNQPLDRATLGIMSLVAH
jgi:hypothetical protein